MTFYYDVFRGTKDIVIRGQLAIKYPAYSHALWEPSPSRLCRPVEVGGVGLIRGGRFHRLFNTLFSVDHPSHKSDVPKY